MVLPLVQQNMLRVWSDTDIEHTLKTLLSKLQAHADGKVTWDEYRKELLLAFRNEHDALPHSKAFNALVPP
jgi:hypothetical protein